ncbi:hypothetical protein Tco_0588271 [Tanacetum coccineum]
MVKESLEDVVLAKESSQLQSSYEDAATLTEFELKKILIDKMDKSKSYLVAPEHKECYEGLIKSYDLDKTIFSTYGTKSQPKSSGKSVQSEEPEFEVVDSDMPQDQEENLGNDDEEPKDKVVQNWRDLPRDIPLDSVVVLRYEKRSKSENKGKVPTKMELVLEQTQQGTSYEVSVSAKGVEELKRKVKIKGEKKEALLTLRQKPERFCTLFGKLVKEILLKLNLPDHRILKDGGEGAEDGSAPVHFSSGGRRVLQTKDSSTKSYLVAEESVIATKGSVIFTCDSAGRILPVS